ncbi:MAG: hypothetical protein R3327_00630 [Nitrosopumilaceae archaeon]|nr:hypothetical protein [Nitrosopumilaceae archaeon]
MTESNFAGNIIVNLANLPDFLRKPILKKRMMEFFSLSSTEKEEIINNALEAGPEIPFPNFSKLFKTWLEILVILSDEQRKELFFSYIDEVSKNPQKLINFNLDGILEIYLSLHNEQKITIAKTIKEIIENLENEKRRRLMIIIPDNAKNHLGL